MRKILVSVILFFCLAGLSLLAEEEIRWTLLTKLGTAPLYRDLDSPERAKEILLKYKEAVESVIADDFISQALYARIKGDETEIKEKQIYPGQEILWMLYAGKKPDEVRMLKYVKWLGNEAVDVYTVYVHYEVIKGKDRYECYVEFVLPKPCGNISLLRTDCIQYEPEPEPEPESRIAPFKPYPSRIEIKPKKNFSLRILYPIPMFSIEAPADILFSTSIEWYFGDWTCYTIDNDVVHLRTNSQLSYEQGVGVSLYESRESSKNQIGIPFGVELGLRLFGNIWALVNYSQSPFYQIRTKEEWNYLYFEEFQKIADGEYQMKLDRISLIQDTQERFFFQNFQLGIRGEIPVYQDITKILLGAGLDFLKVNRNFEKKIRESELAIWSDQILAEQVETSQTKDSKWFNRVFVLAGMMMDLRVVEGLGLGVQGKYYFPLREREVEFQKSYLLPADPDVWKITPPQYSVEVFISFSF